jgi:integrase
MAKPTPGLRKKGNIWQIEKIICGQRIYQSTGETELEAAEKYLAQLTAKIRQVQVYGERLERTFDQAAARFVEDFGHKRSIDRDITTLKAVMPFIGEQSLRKIHAGSLEAFIQARKADGISAGTLNRDMAVIRRVLTLSARLWRDEQGRPWLDTVPMFPAISGEKRKPRPISWIEQERLIRNMPAYLAEMVIFALNTGLRDQEICGLRWEHEFKVQSLDASVFVITAERTKNGRERIVPLNAIARSIINKRRGKGEFVFEFDGNKLSRMNNKAWRKAREAAGLIEVRVHDLRHTFGKRLRAMGVTMEDRQDLLGHHAGRITTDYSKVEIAHLIDCVELLCEEKKKPELTLIRRAS